MMQEHFSGIPAFSHLSLDLMIKKICAIYHIFPSL